MSDLIDRQEAIEAIDAIWTVTGDKNVAKAWQQIIDLPSAEPKIIHCKDCKWWDSVTGKTGYCHAAKHGYYSTHWEIHICRTYDGEFYCADAERRTDDLQ